MRSTLKLSISILVLSCLLFSGFQLSLKASTDQEYHQRSVPKVTPFIASLVAQSWLSTKGKEHFFHLSDVELIKDMDQTQVLAYLFTLSPKGYIVIANSYDLFPVIAYSFTSPTQASWNKNDPFFEFLRTDISSKINIKNDMIKHKEIIWKEYISFTAPKQIAKNFQQWPPEGSTQTEGWVETTWHQSSPYNDMCPMDKNAYARSIAGCPAIAMGQILTYHECINNVFFNDSDDYHHSYQFNFIIDDDHEEYQFPSFDQLNSYLDTVRDHFNQGILTTIDVAAIIFACGVAAEQVYTAQVSGTFSVDQAYQAYQKFNCTSAVLYQQYSEDVMDEVIDDIKNAQPVHLAVVTPSWNAGHNLIMDGYNTDDYFHLNFGWDGVYDGWYHFPDDLPMDLTVLEGVITNIMDDVHEEDLTIEGSITLSDIIPGSQVNASFYVINQGEPDSKLDWEIIRLPSWGDWTVTPTSFSGLCPEDDPVLVSVEVKIPARKKQTFTGGIILVNSNVAGDKASVPISITTPRSPSSLHEVTHTFIPDLFSFWLYQMFN